MKTLRTLAAAGMVCVSLYVIASAAPKSPPDPATALKSVNKLAEAGNHREAADAGKALLEREDTPGDLAATALATTVRALQNLGGYDEAESVIESAAQKYASSSLVLSEAGAQRMALTNHGSLVDGKFRRGATNNSGSPLWCATRDRVRAMQLLTAAWKVLPPDASESERTQLFDRLVNALAVRTTPTWKLQALTDLTTLPDYEEARPYHHQPDTGYPVDVAGEPVWIREPASFEAAKNDGERWRFVLGAKSRVSESAAVGAKWELASAFGRWFGVQTVANVIPLGSGTPTEMAKTKTGITALHTLEEGETCVRLATGVRRLTLPEEFQFLRMHRELAALGPKRAFARDSRQSVIAELLARRQFTRAAEFIRESLPAEKDRDQRRALNDQLDQITGHWGSFLPTPAQPAGRKAKLPLSFRNADTATITARKVNVKKLTAETESYLRSGPRADRSDERERVNSLGHRLINRGPEKYVGKPVAEWTVALQPAADHWDKQLELETPLEEPGAYWIEAKFAGGHVARALLWIEGLTLVEWRQEDSANWFVCDAVSGAPVAGAKVRFFGYSKDWQDQRGSSTAPHYNWEFREFNAVSNAQGLVDFPRDRLIRQGGTSSYKGRVVKRNSDSFQWLITAQDDLGREAHHGFEQIYLGHSSSRDVADRYYAITDRPVYRPGQEVKWKLWARKVDYADGFDTNAFKGSRIYVEILNPRREKAFEKYFTADEHGGMDDTLKLPDDAALGVWTIRAGSSGMHAFRVEEYKKPEFEVKVEAPEKPIALGETFEAKVKADYYFGGPVRQGRVKYRVTRTPERMQWQPFGVWDWLYGPGYAVNSVAYRWYPGWERWCFFTPRDWWGRGAMPPELVTEGELPIGADGTLAIKVDTSAAKELHGKQDHRYTIEAEVTDASRRTIVSSGTVLAARRPFEVYVWLQGGFFRTGEPAKAFIAARTLDGRAVNASGTLRALRVTYDDDGTPNEEELDSSDIKTGSDATVQELKWKRPGQYRLAVSLKDADGHEQETSCFTLVRGGDEDDTKDLRFDDLELLTEKTEYRPGEEVEVVVNTNQPGSTVALFVRPLSTVYPAPVWLHPKGKSATYRFTVQAGDRPNIWLEAFTVGGARVHRATRQVLVPPQDRIATVELEPDRKDYRPRDRATATLRVKTADGRPLAGEIVLTAYDKSLEYISGGSNQPDIRAFFWGWKRFHQPQLIDFLRMNQGNLVKNGEQSMQPLGAWYGDWARGLSLYGDSDLGLSYGRSFSLSSSGGGYGMGGGWSLRGNYTYSGSFDLSGGALELASGGVPMLGNTSGNFANGLVKSRSGGWAITPDSIDGLLAERTESGKLGLAGGGGFAPVALIRSNLADSAVWVASARTNEAGEASVEFEMPDNLTTWKLRAWVMGSHTEVGEASVEVITNKDVMVRLEAPRFFVEKDEAVLSAIVHNELDTPQVVRGEMQLEGGTLALLEGENLSQQADIPAHGEKRFDWRVRAVAEGEATVRVKALAQADSDAMEMKFPVHVHGMLRTESWSVALRPGQPEGAIKFTVPAERREADTRLEVRCSPTLAMALVDALPYLADYPHGCAEQTLNKFVPTVLVLKLLKDLKLDLGDLQVKEANLNAQEQGEAENRAKRWQGKDGKGRPRSPVFDEVTVQHMAATGLARLKAMRSSDGGWGWFPGGRESSTHITALVVRGLLTAKAAGLDVDGDLIERGAQWLQRHEQRELALMRLPEKHRDHKAWPDNEDALVHFTLVDCGKGDKAMRTRLYEGRKHLSRMNVALLGLACHTAKQQEQRDMCLRNVRQFVHEDAENQTAWVELGAEASWWRWWDDRIETQAALLRLLSVVEPEGELAPRLAKHLLNNRRNGGAWQNTRDTAAVIEALAAFVKASGESEPDLKYTLLVDGRPLREVTVNRENLFTHDAALTLSADALAAGEHTLEFRKEGKSPLYANAFLSVFTKEDMIRAAGLEVKVARKFYKLTEEKKTADVAGARGELVAEQRLKYARTELLSGDPVRSGDLVEVELTVESKNDYEYVMLEDPKPAGFEPVSVRSGWNYDGLAAYQEFRDAKVCLYAERLPQGKSVLSYRVRAEVPGAFSALPSTVEAMYAPELRGNADEWRAVIDDRE